MSPSSPAGAAVEKLRRAALDKYGRLSGPSWFDFCIETPGRGSLPDAEDAMQAILGQAAGRNDQGGPSGAQNQSAAAVGLDTARGHGGSPRGGAAAGTFGGSSRGVTSFVRWTTWLPGYGNQVEHEHDHVGIQDGQGEEPQARSTMESVLGQRYKVPLWDVPRGMQLHSIIVPTQDTRRAIFVASLLMRHKKHGLLVGPTGTGKTALIRGMIDGLHSDRYSTAVLQLSSTTSAA